MGNAAVAEELPGADELDELYRLDASETRARGRSPTDEMTTTATMTARTTTTREFKPDGMPHQ